MSQLIDETTPAVQEPRQREEFTYKPVPPLAPVTMVIATCAVSSLVSIFGIALALAGVVTGFLCMTQILRSRGELGGKILTLIGLTLSVSLLVGGSSLHAYIYATEVPEGFRRISFLHDVSEKAPILEAGVVKVHPDVNEMNGKKVFIKGFVYPTRQTKGLTEFVLVKDSEKCCFGGQPSQTDMILVRMEPGKTIDYMEGLVSVAGEFKAGVPQRSGVLAPIYELKGAYYSRAKTAY